VTDVFTIYDVTDVFTIDKSIPEVYGRAGVDTVQS